MLIRLRSSLIRRRIGSIIVRKITIVSDVTWH